MSEGGREGKQERQSKATYHVSASPLLQGNSLTSQPQVGQLLTL